MEEYVGFGSKVTVGETGIKTEITIDNKKYPAEKITEIIDSIESQIKEIEKKLDLMESTSKELIIEQIEAYNSTSNPISKIKIVHKLLEVGANVTTIAVNLLDIKTKLDL